MSEIKNQEKEKKFFQGEKILNVGITKNEEVAIDKVMSDDEKKKDEIVKNIQNVDIASPFDNKKEKLEKKISNSENNSDGFKNIPIIKFFREKIFNRSIRKKEFDNEMMKFITPEFLRQQINLHPKERNKIFKWYVRKKKKEFYSYANLAESEEEYILRESFDRYMDGLGFTEEDIRNKRIVDLGSGEGGFVISCIQKGITQEAYGVDIDLDRYDINDDYKKHFFKRSFDEKIPIENVDYIVSVGAVAMGIFDGGKIEDVERIIENSLDALNEKGEIRICFIKEPAVGSPDFNLYNESYLKWVEIMENFSNKKKNIEWQIEPGDLFVGEKRNELALDSVLVINKK